MNSARKSRIKPTCVKFKFLIQDDGGKTQIYTRHCSKQTSKLSQLKNKKFEFTYKYFPCHLLTAQR